jgi:hypothetical protein
MSQRRGGATTREQQIAQQRAQRDAA